MTCEVGGLPTGDRPPPGSYGGPANDVAGDPGPSAGDVARTMTSTTGSLDMQPVIRRVLATTGVLGLLVTAGCGDEGSTSDEAAELSTPTEDGTSPDGDGETPTDPAPATVTETGTDGDTVPATPPAGATSDPGMDFVVTPEPPVVRKTGSKAEFLTGSTTDEAELPRTLLAGYVPCEQAHFSTEVVFADDDDDGVVGHWGETTAGDATLEEINGKPHALDDQPGEVETSGADVSMVFSSGAPDCLVLVVFEDTSGDGELNLDGADVPVEPFGASKALWEG